MGVPYYDYSITGPKTLFYLLRPLQKRPRIPAPLTQHPDPRSPREALTDNNASRRQWEAGGTLGDRSVLGEFMVVRSRVISLFWIQPNFKIRAVVSRPVEVSENRGNTVG